MNSSPQNSAGVQRRSKRRHPMRKQIETAQEHVPPYLFRVFCDHSGGSTDSSGRLNSSTAITPWAFDKGRGHEDLFELSAEYMTEMARAHFHGKKHIETEFSSWSGSILIALAYALRLKRRGQKGIHIAVLPTHGLPNIAGIIPSMMRVYDEFDWTLGEFFPSLGKPKHQREGYLVHGVVKGFKAVPLDDILKEGLLEAIPALKLTHNKKLRDGWGRHLRRLLFPFNNKPKFSPRKPNLRGVELLTDEDDSQSGPDTIHTSIKTRFTAPSVPDMQRRIEIGKRIGQLFGPRFTLAIACALLSCNTQSWTKTGEPTPAFDLPEDLALTLHGLADLPAQPEWSQQRTIMQEGYVMTQGFPDIQELTGDDTEGEATGESTLIS